MRSIEAGVKANTKAVDLERYRISEEASLQRSQLWIKAAMAVGLATLGIIFLVEGRETAGMGLRLGAVGILTGLSNAFAAARALFRPPHDGSTK